MRNAEEWFRVLVACQVKPTIAARWSGAFSEAVGPEKFSQGEKEIPEWLGQILHETGRLTQLEENLNYSAEGLLKTWPSRFNQMSARAFERMPRSIANRVYGGRLGNTGPDDGWLYRGRGLIQVTGKANYAALEKAMGVPLLSAPEILVLPKYALRSAILWWENNVPDADLGDRVKIRRRVNGGTLGLADTAQLAAAAEKAMQA